MSRPRRPISSDWDDVKPKGEGLLGPATLLECPFCGAVEECEHAHNHVRDSNGYIGHPEAPHGKNDRHALQCWACGAVGPFTFYEDKIREEWNKRSTGPEIKCL